MRHIWIDTDMGSDDAVALIMALRYRDVEVVGISTVAGNVAIDQATRNALQVVDLCTANVPVYAGAAGPLTRPLSTAEWFHGPDGFSGAGERVARAPADSPAHEAMVAASRAHPGLIVVTIGPLTNLAKAVQTEPTFTSAVGRCVVMGGAACTYGNVTPAAEYNIWVDPESARVVFNSGLPVEMVGWEFCRGEYALNGQEIDRIRLIGSRLAAFTLESNRKAIEAYFIQTGERRLSFPDPVAMAVALEPDIVTERSLHLVEVETQSELTRGMTVVDRLNVGGDSRNRVVWEEALSAGQMVHVAWNIDSSRWKEMLYASLKEE